MMASTTVETRLGARPASTAAVPAVGKVLGVRPKSPARTELFGAVVHTGYGAGWGLARALLGQLGLSGPAAATVRAAALWTSEQIALPALGVTAPITRQRARDIAPGAWNCLVYAAVTGAVCEALDRAR
jgi:hypothetical protein